jgi:hypothetical protein
MISERGELLGQLLRYHALIRGVTDRTVQEALQTAIHGIERRLALLDTPVGRPNSGAAAQGRRRSAPLRPHSPRR